VIGNAPTYGATSTLLYNNANLNVRGLEWSAMTGPGYPQNVTINSQLDMVGVDASNIPYACSGDITINIGGQLDLLINPYAGTLTANNIIVNGDLIAGAINSEIVLNGDLTVGSVGTIPYSAGSNFTFTGSSATQLFTSNSATLIVLERIQNNKAVGVLKLVMPNATSLSIKDVGSNGAIVFNNTNGQLDLNGENINVTDPMGQIITNQSGTIFSSGGECTVHVGEGSTKIFGPAALTFGTNVILTTNTNAVTVDFSAGNTTINHKFIHQGNNLTIAGSPNYGTSSTLVYAQPLSSTSIEWLSDAIAGAGVPANVVINENVTFPAMGSFKRANGNITVAAGKTLNTNNHDLEFTGNFLNDGTFTNAGTYLSARGSSAQTLACATAIPKLKINKVTGNLVLASNNTVSTEINFISGNINLNGSNALTLQSASSVVGETALRTFINSTPTLNGYIQYTQVVAAPSSFNFGNLGSTLALSTGSGEVRLRRIPSLTRIVAAGRNAANNIFQLYVYNTTSFNADLSIKHSTFNLNGSTSGSLKLWESPTANNLNHTIDASSIDAAGSVTSTPITTWPNNTTLYYTVANAAPVAVTKTTKLNGGNWSVAANWSPAGVPNPGDNIIINHTGFSVDVDYTELDSYGTFTVNAGKSLNVLANNDIYISSSITNNGTITTNTGSAIHTIGTTNFAHNGAYNTAGLSNFNMHDGGTITGNAITFSGLTIGGDFTATNTAISINDTLKFNDVANWNVASTIKPIYGSNSTLVYATGTTINRGLEWSALSGAGYPYNVAVRNGTSFYLDGGQPTVARALANKLSIGVLGGSTGEFYANAMQAALTVKHLAINSGHLYVSSNALGKIQINQGDAYCYDGYGIQAGGVNSTIEFKSISYTQHFTGQWYYGGKLVFDYSFSYIDCSLDVELNNSYIDFKTVKGVRNCNFIMFGNCTLNAAVANTLYHGGISGHTGQPSTISFTGAGNFKIQAPIFYFPAATNTINYGVNKVTLDTAILHVNNLTVTGFPTYTSNSTLLYYDTQTTGSEWQVGSGNGSPYNVNFLGSNVLTVPTGNYYVRGNLTLDNGGGNPTIDLDSPTNLFVGGNITSSTSAINCNNCTVNLYGSNNHALACGGNYIDSLVLNTTGITTLTNNFFSDVAIYFIQGNLDLNGNVLEITGSQIYNENNNNHIFDSGTNGVGYVRLSKNNASSAINSTNNGGIGFEATTTDVAGFGSTTIKRYYKHIAGVGAVANIDRVYELYRQNGPIAVKATAVKYFGNELNGNTPNANMKVFRSDNISSSSSYLPTAATTNTYPADPTYKTSAEQTEIPMLSSIMFFTASNLDAAYVGSYNVPSVTFPTIEDAVTLLNASGVGTTGVTLNVTNDYTLNVPLDFDFTNTINAPTAANPLIITGNPMSPPTITGYSGLTSDRDAFIRVLGTDYLTVQNINFVDPPANNTQLLSMEWGIALLKSGPGNGIRFNTIKNCHINMHTANTVATGIYVGNHNSDPTAPYAPSTTGGTNSNNTLQSNVINGANIGIFVNGYDDPANTYQDSNWQIGDTANPSLGNVIENFGGTAAVPAYGIRARNTNQIIIGKNTINNIAGGGIAGNNALTGIEVQGASNANSYIKYNVVGLQQGANGFNTVAINGNMSGTQSLNIQSNLLQNNGQANGATGNFRGIQTLSPPTRLRVQNNQIINSTGLNSTGDFAGIFNEGGVKVHITGNTINTITTNSNTNCYGIYNTTAADSSDTQFNNVFNYTQTGSGGTFFGYCNNDSTVTAFQAGGGVEIISNNHINTVIVAGSTSIIGLSSSVSPSRDKTVNINRLRNFTANTGQVMGAAIRNGSDIISDNNKINNFTTKGNINGVRLSEGTTVTLSNDSIYNFTQTQNGVTYGINSTVNSGASARTFSANNITNFVRNNPTAAGETSGIIHTSNGTGGPHNVVSNSNRVTNIVTAGSGATSGIIHTSNGTGGPHNLSTTSNVVNLVTTTGSGATSGIIHTSNGTGGPHNLSTNSNTVTFVGSTGGGAVNGIIHTSNGTGGPHNLVSNSNTVTNLSGTGSGGVSGISSSSTVSNPSQARSITSNNNIVNTITGTGSGATSGIIHTSNGTGGPHNSSRVGNAVSNISNTGGGSTSGIIHTSNGTGGPHNLNTQNNTISTLTSTTGSTSGIIHTSNGTGGPHNITSRGNTISNLSSGTGATSGIIHTSNGTGGPHNQRVIGNTLTRITAVNNDVKGIYVSGLVNVLADSTNIQDNKISKVRNTGNGSLTGIEVSSGKITGIIKNNVIGDVKTNTASGANDLKGINVNGAAATTLKLYYNTIYLNDTNITSGFGSSGLVLDNASTIDMRNNIIINNCENSSGGMRVIEKLGAASNIASTSNNNIFYVRDSTTSGHFVYSDGVNNFQNFGAYKAFAIAQNGRETASAIENSVFVSLNGDDAGFMKLNAAIPTRAESGGSVSNLGILTDRDGNPRFGAGGYIGTGTATDIGAFESNLLPAIHTWVGGASSNWNTPANWTGGVMPAITDNVIIPKVSAPFNQPNVSTVDATINNILHRTVSGVSPTINLGANRILNVKGNLTGDATYTGTGKVAMNGVSAQLISNNVTITNIDMDNAASVSLPAGAGNGLNVRARLALVNGAFNTSDNLSLKSSSSTTGYLSGSGAGTINGQVNVERYIGGSGLAGYHYIGSPVIGNNVLNHWGDDFSIQGTDNFVHIPNVLTTNYVTVWQYDESNPNPDFAYGYVSATSAADVLNPGMGYAAIIPAGTVVDVKGNVHHNSAFTSVFNITNTPSGNAASDGYNIIANPYASPIQWSLLKALPGQVALDGSMYMWITSGVYGGTYQSHNGIIGSGGGISNTIALGQGFYVHKSTVGSAPFIADNSIRTDNNTATFFDDPVLANSLDITLGFNGGMDATNLTFYPGATDGYDAAYDATKFLNYSSANALVYTKDNVGVNYGMNFMPELSTLSNCVVPLDIEPRGAGTYTFTFGNVASFASTATVMLEDAVTGTWQNLVVNNTYSIALNNSNCNNRFFLHFANNAITDVETLQANEAAQSSIYVVGNKLYVANYGATTTTEKANIVVFNAIGEQIINKQVSLNKGIQQFELPELSNGTYIVKLQSDTKTLTNKLVWR